jgi:L-glyceraldehyde 3-phosphate reductase
MYQANDERYASARFRRCGQSGIQLPEISLGLWHNFGGGDDFESMQDMLFTSFDNGITHFDLANNYGPPYGSAEINFGKILKTDLAPYRDELIISTKAGWDMWPGPYGDLGSRKYLISSLDQSLKRMNLEYVDIFYHHRPDPNTPLEETMGALDQIVRSGKALYVGVSQYDAERTEQAASILSGMDTPFLIHQPRYNMMDRWIEPELLPTLENIGIGCIVFSPLAQGLLTDRYLDSIPEDSRAAREKSYLSASRITPEHRQKLRGLKRLAEERGESLAQMATNWVLRKPGVTSALIGASKVSQILELLKGRSSAGFSSEELKNIDSIMGYD